MANTWATTLAALTPDHHWLLDELAGNFIDDGAVGGFDLVEFSAADSLWRQAPLLGPRGTPLTYGQWNDVSDNRYAQFAGGPTVAGHNTGGFGHWFVGLSDQDEIRPFGTTHIDNAALTTSFRFFESGTIRFECTGTSGRFIRKQTSAANGWKLGVPVFVYCEQRNDGTGLHLYINGVENFDNVTAFGGAGVDIDSWVSEVDAGFAVTQTTIGGLRNNLDGSERFIVGECFMFVNNVIDDDSALANLYASANRSAVASDYHEGVADLGWADESLVVWNAHYNVVGTGISAGAGIGDFRMNSTGFNVGPSAQNVADDVVGRRVVSDYQRFKQTYGTNDPTYFNSGGTNWDGAPAIGTVNAVVTVTAVGDGLRKIIWTYGTAQNNSMELGLVGSVLGYQLFFRVFQSSVETYRVLSGIIHLGADPQFYMLSVVQPGDGSGFRIYVNDQDETGIAPITTNPDTWVDDFAGNTRWGGEQGSQTVDNFEPGELHVMHGWTKAFSPGQIELLYGYVLGQFPAELPFGSFATELQTTGNMGQGPDWWWRMNVAFAPLADIGIAQTMGGPNANTIVEGGDPLFRVSGPLEDDAGNFSVFFDGVGDYFEVGLDGVPGQLVSVSTGTIGCFFSRNALVDENIIYGQSNDAGTAFWRFKLNGTAVELIVQTSVGNRVTLTSSVQLSTNAFGFLVLTCDAVVYRLYIDGVEDTGASVVVVGAGAEGDWFDALVADNSAIASEADVGFTTETTGRISELFLYDGDVLGATSIASLYEAAIADGITGTAAPAGLLIFENVTFKNGALSDIRASNAQPGTFQQIVRGNRLKFLGGQQGDGFTEPQCVLLEGPAHATFRGCEADLQATPGFGRGGIVGTAIDPAVVATQDGSLLVSDCDFDRMGLLDGATFLSPVMLLAAFGMTVEDSRFNDCLGTAVGWRADAQRVSVVDNQIEGVTQALGAIYSAQGSNARLGNAWLIRGNKGINTDGPAINLNGASSAGGTSFARNIAIQKNELDNNLAGSAIRVNQIGDCLIEKNKGNRSTFGVELVEIAGRIAVLGNEMDNASQTAYFAGEATLQLADVTMDRNLADGASVGDGLLITQVRRAYITNNQLSNMDNGVGIGEIAVEGTFDGNNIVQASTPFQFLAATARVAFDIGINRIESLGNANQITVSAATIDVQAHYHTITASAPINLDTIDGPLVDGFTLILRRGLFSSDITLRDGIDNLNIGSDFLMDVDNDQIWLVRDGANWNQLQRVQAL